MQVQITDEAFKVCVLDLVLECLVGFIDLREEFGAFNVFRTLRKSNPNAVAHFEGDACLRDMVAFLIDNRDGFGCVEGLPVNAGRGEAALLKNFLQV